jgi:hypothetical protein
MVKFPFQQIVLMRGRKSKVLFPAKKTIRARQGGETIQLAGSEMRIKGRVLSPKERKAFIRHSLKRIGRRPSDFEPDLMAVLERAVGRLPSNHFHFFVEIDGMLLESRKKALEVQKLLLRDITSGIRGLLNRTPERDRARLLYEAVEFLQHAEVEVRNKAVFYENGRIEPGHMDAALRRSTEIIRAIQNEARGQAVKKCFEWFQALPERARKSPAGLTKSAHGIFVSFAPSYEFAFGEFRKRIGKIFPQRRAVDERELALFGRAVETDFLRRLRGLYKALPVERRVLFLKRLPDFCENMWKNAVKQSAEVYLSMPKGKRANAGQMRAIEELSTIFFQTAQALEIETQKELARLEKTG